MTNTRAQRIKNILNEIDKISHPPRKIIPISEVEEEISKYKDHTLNINRRSRQHNRGLGIERPIRLPAP